MLYQQKTGQKLDVFRCTALDTEHNKYTVHTKQKKQNIQNSTITACYYHLVIFVNVNTSKMGVIFFIHVCKRYLFILFS